jgi:hypothetical protein
MRMEDEMGIGIEDGVEARVSLETLARMSLDTLLYYVLLGAGRRRIEMGGIQRSHS